MVQIKIYGLRSEFDPIKAQLSDVIHSCVVDALSFPTDKRTHRFFPLAPEDFYMPAGRTDRYVIIEISLFEGRSAETKKTLIRLLFESCETQLSLLPADVEITLTETPRCNWGFRGQTGDELELNYSIQI